MFSSYFVILRMVRSTTTVPLVQSPRHHMVEALWFDRFCAQTRTKRTSSIVRKHRTTRHYDINASSTTTFSPPLSCREISHCSYAELDICVVSVLTCVCLVCWKWQRRKENTYLATSSLPVVPGSEGIGESIPILELYYKSMTFESSQLNIPSLRHGCDCRIDQAAQSLFLCRIWSLCRVCSALVFVLRLGEGVRAPMLLTSWTSRTSSCLLLHPHIYFESTKAARVL